MMSKLNRALVGAVALFGDCGVTAQSNATSSNLPPHPQGGHEHPGQESLQQKRDDADVVVEDDDGTAKAAPASEPVKATTPPKSEPVKATPPPKSEPVKATPVAKAPEAKVAQKKPPQAKAPVAEPAQSEEAAGNSLVNKMKSAGDKLREKMQGAYQGAKDAVGNAVGKVKADVAGTETWKKVEPYAKRAANTAQVVAGDLKDVVVKPLVETVGPMPKKLGERLRGSAKHADGRDIHYAEYFAYFIIITILCWLVLMWIGRVMLYSLCCLLCCGRRKKVKQEDKSIELPAVATSRAIV